MRPTITAEAIEKSPRPRPLGDDRAGGEPRVTGDVVAPSGAVTPLDVGVGSLANRDNAA